MTEPILKFRLGLDGAFRQKEIRNEFFGGVKIKFPFGSLEMELFGVFYFEILLLDQINQGRSHF